MAKRRGTMFFYTASDDVEQHATLKASPPHCYYMMTSGDRNFKGEWMALCAMTLAEHLPVLPSELRAKIINMLHVPHKLICQCCNCVVLEDVGGTYLLRKEYFMFDDDGQACLLCVDCFGAKRGASLHDPIVL